MAFETKHEQLLCKLTEEELKARAHRLASTVAELEGVALRKKDLTAGLNAEQKRIEAERSHLAMIVREGKESRPVVVEITRDYAHAELVETRTDTGEVVRRRTLTTEEMQQELPLDAMNRIIPDAGKQDDDDGFDDEEAKP